MVRPPSALVHPVRSGQSAQAWPKEAVPSPAPLRRMGVVAPVSGVLAVILPVVFVVLFSYVFGSAISIPGGATIRT